MIGLQIRTAVYISVMRIVYVLNANWRTLIEIQHGMCRKVEVTSPEGWFYLAKSDIQTRVLETWYSLVCLPQQKLGGGAVPLGILLYIMMSSSPHNHDAITVRMREYEPCLGWKLWHFMAIFLWSILMLSFSKLKSSHRAHGFCNLQSHEFDCFHGYLTRKNSSRISILLSPSIETTVTLSEMWRHAS